MMEEVLKYIPHRPPFLFVDRLVEYTENRIRTQREVRADEPYFQGHYPGHPVMPGVLICESVFQTGAILISKLTGETSDRIPVISRINNVKFKHGVKPGDLMEAEVNLKEKIGPAYYLEGKVTVGSKKILTLEFVAMMVEDIA